MSDGVRVADVNDAEHPPLRANKGWQLIDRMTDLQFPVFRIEFRPSLPLVWCNNVEAPVQ